MAEAFARAYGEGVIEASSAGISPLDHIPELTRKVMEEKAIGLNGQYPKSLHDVDLKQFDLIVNMSGYRLNFPETVEVQEWKVPDPYGLGLEAFRQTRDLIESKVLELVNQLSQKRNHMVILPGQ